MKMFLNLSPNKKKFVLISLYDGKCSAARLSKSTTMTPLWAVFLLLLFGGCVTASLASDATSQPWEESRNFDNTTINTSNNWKYLLESLERLKRSPGGGRSKKEHTCDDSPNKNLCLPKSYSKFELPFTDSVNVVEIGIDIIDVLRINDKVRYISRVSAKREIQLCILHPIQTLTTG